MRGSASKIIAVDVAVVPPEWVQRRARAINVLLDGPPDGFRFDETHMPHVSLAQLFTARASLPLFVGVLDLILRGRARFDLRVLAAVRKDGNVSYLLDRTPELWTLHEDLMNGCKEWEELEGTAEAFYSEGEPPRDKDVVCVANYRTEASYRKFIPHITLGFGAAPPPGEPFDFTADRIALFYLGRFCTCRLPLHEWTL